MLVTKSQTLMPDRLLVGYGFRANLFRQVASAAKLYH